MSPFSEDFMKRNCSKAGFKETATNLILKKRNYKKWFLKIHIRKNIKKEMVY